MEYKLKRSRRKTIELSIGDDLVPEVKAPLFMPEREIEAFIEKHRRWIEKHITGKKERMEKEEVSPEREKELRKAAQEYLPERTAYFSAIMGLRPTGVKITSAKKRFGSCNAKNSICYSWHLMEYPPEAIDYVVVHEIAHIAQKNHGKKFYMLVEKYLPDYRERIKLLK